MNVNSDVFTTMAATLKFDDILRTIQSSNLNFHLEISPFSAIIHMKKTLITNKFGISLFPPPADSALLDQEKSQNSVLSQKIVFLETEISDIKRDYEEALLGQNEALGIVAELEKELKASIADTTVQKEEILANVKTEAGVNEEIIKLKQEKKSLESLLNENVYQISDLNSEIRRIEAVSNTLNQELVKTRTKSPSIKSDNVKALKVEIKLWRKELGEERRQKINLEKALSELEAKVTEPNKTLTPSTRSADNSNSSSLGSFAVAMSPEPCIPNSSQEDCTICAEPIQNYEPEYFNGIEMNPACDDCKPPIGEIRVQSEDLFNGTTAVTVVDVITKNKFETLGDINDNNETPAQHLPEPRLECESSNQASSSSAATASFAVTSSSSNSSQERIQCDQCLRKCVDKRDMEHHIYLWHTDTETQVLMSRKIFKHVT